MEIVDELTSKGGNRYLNASVLLRPVFYHRFTLHLMLTTEILPLGKTFDASFQVLEEYETRQKRVHSAR